MSKKWKINSNFAAFSQFLNFKENIDRIPYSIEVLQTYLLWILRNFLLSKGIFFLRQNAYLFYRAEPSITYNVAHVSFHLFSSKHLPDCCQILLFFRDFSLFLTYCLHFDGLFFSLFFSLFSFLSFIFLPSFMHMRRQSAQFGCMLNVQPPWGAPHAGVNPSSGPYKNHTPCPPAPSCPPPCRTPPPSSPPSPCCPTP